MCGIAFVKGEELYRVLGRQRERGLDGIGIGSESCYGWKGFHPSRNDNGQYISDETRFNWYIDYIKEIVEKEKLEEEFCLFHHRKSSVGSVTLDNVHPLKTKKFSIMQNGTERILRQWGDVEGIPSDKSDTFCLVSFLSLKANSLDEIIDILNNFGDRLLDIGVLLIRDIKTDKILFYSDGKRESYITFGTKKNTIDKIESWHGTDRRIQHKNKGWMIFDFKGKISKMSIDIPNDESKSKVNSYAYTDDEGKTKYNSSYDTAYSIKDPYGDYDERTSMFSSKKKKTNKEETVLFMTKVRQSINKGDISLKEIREIPEDVFNTLKNNKALKKFKKTYEQAIRRAMKHDEEAVKPELPALLSAAQQVFDDINAAAKADQGSILANIEKDIEIHSLLKKLDDGIALEDSVDVPPENIVSDEPKRLENYWYKFETFLQCVDWTTDIATDTEVDWYRHYDTTLESIDVFANKVTISRKHYFTTITREVDLLIDKSDNSFSIIDTLNKDTPLKIKVEGTYCEPILCESLIS